jgi:chitinase
MKTLATTRSRQLERNISTLHLCSKLTGRSTTTWFIEPVFEAGVAVDAQLDIEITPEASIGIKIGGGKLIGGTTIMDAQLHGYIVGDLSFQAHGDYSTSTNKIRYSFGAYFIYNLGYTATAQILGLFDWALGPRVAYPSNKSIELYFKEGSIPLSADDSTNSQAIGERSFPS